MRFYELLLMFYPAAFRAEYGQELCQLFAQRRRAISGGISLLFFWIGEMIDTFWNAAQVHWDIFQRDLRFTARTVLRAPGFAVTAILVTALGIGANTAVFSVVNHVLIRPLPYKDSDRIVRLWERNSIGFNEVAPPNYLDWQRASTSFESMAAYAATSMNLVGIGYPERFETTMMTSNLLPLLGVKPVIGRSFTKEEDRTGSAGTVLISYGLWQTRFGGNVRAIGQTVRLNDETFTLIGVLPAGFSFPDRETQLWTPMRITPEDWRDRQNNYFKVVGKLKKEVSVEEARAEMAIIAQKLEKEYPEENAKKGIAVQTLRDGVSQQSRLMLAALLGASICVLLIACTNLAGLFLVRAIGRRRELTVRAALGAGRERLVRQLLTESFVFVFFGALIGVLVANAAVPLLSRLIPTTLPVGEATVMDLRVLIFAAILLCLTVITFGVVPALRICSRADASALREGARSGMGERRDRLRSALVIAEVTASVILLISSGLLIRALWRIQAIDPGFSAENVMTMQTPLTWPKYERTAQRVDFYARVLSGVRAMPDVSNAAYITGLPMVMRGNIWPILQEGGIERNPGESEVASVRFVTPGFFDTLRIPLKLGRDIQDSDTFSSPYVAVVSESFAEKVWPGSRENPVGRRFYVAERDRTIVGVVGDIKVRGLERASEPQLYLPGTQVEDRALIGYPPKVLVVRTKEREETGTYDTIRSIIQKVDPEMPISDIRTLQEVVEAETTPRVTQVRVIGAFALLSLLLAGIGIHGLLAFAVSQRIPEIGLRMALGARSGEIIKMVMNKGLVVATIGGLLGVVLAYGAAKSMEALLAGIKPGDALTFTIACALALFVTLTGCLFPALRAIRVDPAKVMRTD
jgi:predicted permease